MFDENGEFGTWEQCAEACMDTWSNNQEQRCTAIEFSSLSFYSYCAFWYNGACDIFNNPCTSDYGSGLPDDYCFVGLIIGHAKSRNLRSALEIKQLMLASNVKETVHTYNALIYVADVCGEYEKVVDLYETMLRKGIQPNLSTQELVVNVGKKGAKFYEETQLAASVASAAAGIVGVVGMALGRW